MGRDIVVLCVALYLGLTVQSLAQEGDTGQTLTRGSFVIRPARIIVIPANVTVRLTEDTVLAADEIRLDGAIVTEGFTLHIDARRMVWGPAAQIVAFEGPPRLPPNKPQAARGPQGVPNYSLPRTMRDGGSGDPGATGNPGIPGHPNPGPILYVAGQSLNPIKIDARGQNGGKGGIGGQGGIGGDGAPGLSASASCDGWGASCFGYGSVYGGGSPGNGGPGGRGGKGGFGGRAVPVVVALGDPADHNHNELLLGPGAGGEQGDPGPPGPPGSPGQAGRSDGCCGGPFGLFCCDKGGAPGGTTPSFPPPGNLGSEGPGEEGQNIDPDSPIFAPFRDVPSELSPNGALVSLKAIYANQLDVVSVMSEFHVTRIYTYLLARSLALTGYPLPAILPDRSDYASSTDAPQPDPEIAAIIADLWRSAFVQPLQAAVEAGGTTFPTSDEWLSRGQMTVRLLLEAMDGTGATMPIPLAALFLEAQNETVDRAKGALASCQNYTGALTAVGSQAILLSHHVAIPACTQLPELAGVQLFLSPLTIYEPLPQLPELFRPYLKDLPLQVAVRGEEGKAPRFAALFGQLAEIFVATANAQAIDVKIRLPTSASLIISPEEIGMDSRRLSGKRFLIQTSIQETSSYSEMQLLNDLRIFAEMVR